MKQRACILKRNKQMLISCVCLFALTSCYKVDPLPDHIKSDHEIAIPVINTTIEIGDFATFINNDYEIEIPAGAPIDMGEISYPFYIGDYASSQEIKWIEPQIILNTKDLPANTIININIYTKQYDETKYYLGLFENHSITLTNTTVKIPDTPSRITNIERFRSSRNIFLDMSITYPAATPVAEILDDKINIKFAMKFAIKTDLTIKL